MPRVIFINRFYWPDETATAQLLADLAESLAARGHSVAVIASRPAGGVSATERRRGVDIVRIGSSRSRGRGIAAKALDFGTFWLAALGRLARLARRGDTVVALTDPPLIGVGAAAVASLRGARCCHWIQDVYPEVAIALSGARALGALKPIRDAAWRGADACVAIGASMAEAVADAGVPAARISVIANWAPAGAESPAPDETARIRTAWGCEGKFAVAYSGNLGRVHDLDPILDAAEELRADTGIAFVFAGSGPRRAALEAAAAERGLDRVRFRPSQPRALLGSALAAGDLHLVTLRPGCERWVFPSKLYGIASAGRPVLFVGPRGSEMARAVVDGGFGVAFERHEIPGIAAAIRRLASNPADCARLGAAARRFSEASGGAPAAAGAWSRLLASSGRPGQASAHADHV